MATRIIEQLDGVPLEELHLCIRKALGISLALSERMSGDDHDRFCAEAISDNLTRAREILEPKEVSHG